MCKTIEFAKQLVDIANDVSDRRNMLRKKLVELDNAQLDLLHKIENEDKVNVVQGYDFYKALHELRLVRRNVKNELEVCEAFVAKVNPIKANLLSAKQQALSIDNKMKQLHNDKIYKPRQINIKNDIRLEIQKLISGVN